MSVTRPPDIMSSVSSLALVTLTSCVMTSEALSLTQVSVPPFGLGGDKVDLGCEYDTQVCRNFTKVCLFFQSFFFILLKFYMNRVTRCTVSSGTRED